MIVNTTANQTLLLLSFCMLLLLAGAGVGAIARLAALSLSTWEIVGVGRAAAAVPVTASEHLLACRR